MKETTHEIDALERQLSQRFAQLREQDRIDAPPVPADETLLERGAPVTDRRWLMPGVGLAASALLAVFIVAALNNRAPQEDPGALYASIMDSNVLMTDSLMLVSQGASPEIAPLEEIYDVEIPATADGPDKGSADGARRI